MTKKLFVKGLLKNEVQICGYCEYWGCHGEGVDYTLKATCRHLKEMHFTLDGCQYWKWNGKIDKSKKPAAREELRHV